MFVGGVFRVRPGDQQVGLQGQPLARLQRLDVLDDRRGQGVAAVLHVHGVARLGRVVARAADDRGGVLPVRRGAGRADTGDAVERMVVLPSPVKTGLPV